MLTSNFKRGKYWWKFLFKLFLFVKKCKNRKKDLLRERIHWKRENFFRSSCSVVFFGKGVLNICSTLTGEHSCWSAISINLLYRTPFSRLLLFFSLWKDHSQIKQIFIVEQIYVKYPNTFWADKIWSGSAEVARCCFLYFYFILVCFFEINPEEFRKQISKFDVMNFQGSQKKSNNSDDLILFHLTLLFKSPLH